MTFGERLRQAIAERGRLCVGIDPHESVLDGWELDASASGAREFGLRVVHAAAGRVAVVKPQVAFFERWGAAGFVALEDVIAAARAAGLLVIADAKRGDIGSTMDAYARGWFTPGAPLEVDAITVNPYLGVGALHGTFSLALEHDKGVFVLAATSNSEAEVIQRATAGTRTVAGVVAEDVRAFNERTTAPGEWAGVGLVVGATVDLERAGIDERMLPTAPILAPGFGAQGARLADYRSLFGPLAPAVLANESRGIVLGGAKELVARIDSRQAELREADRG
ncbi:orotidine-5'-phosphate decarboxylase [Microbacterium sp. P05]|uniref:orotidine-5'-phosphate decarboxylase n=1 Tax=Microbacterium sp. P05 TaxID=3366948 RepID=UPI003744B9FE